MSPAGPAPAPASAAKSGCHPSLNGSVAFALVSLIPAPSVLGSLDSGFPPSRAVPGGRAAGFYYASAGTARAGWRRLLHGGLNIAAQERPLHLSAALLLGIS